MLSARGSSAGALVTIYGPWPLFPRQRPSAAIPSSARRMAGAVLIARSRRISRNFRWVQLARRWVGRLTRASCRSHAVAAAAQAYVSAQLDRRALRSRVDDAPVFISAANRDERQLELLSSRRSVGAALACLGIARR